MKKKKTFPDALDIKAAALFCTVALFLTTGLFLGIRFIVELIGAETDHAPEFHVLAYGLSMAGSFWIANFIIHFLLFGRGEKFLSAVGERGSVKEGFMWHMKSYWLTEVLVLGCYAVVFPLMYVKGSMCPVWLFYHYLGISRYRANRAQKRNHALEVSLDELEACIPAPAVGVRAHACISTTVFSRDLPPALGKSLFFVKKARPMFTAGSQIRKNSYWIFAENCIIIHYVLLSLPANDGWHGHFTK